MFLDRAVVAAIGEMGWRRHAPRVALGGAIPRLVRSHAVSEWRRPRGDVGRTKPTGKAQRFQWWQYTDRAEPILRDAPCGRPSGWGGTSGVEQRPSEIRSKRTPPRG